MFCSTLIKNTRPGRKSLHLANALAYFAEEKIRSSLFCRRKDHYSIATMAMRRDENYWKPITSQLRGFLVHGYPKGLYYSAFYGRN